MEEKKKYSASKIILVIVLIVGGIIAYNIYDYYKRLDGRECLDCPYVYDLKPADVVIHKKELRSNGANRGYTATVIVGTVHEELKVDGTITVRYTCKIDYCFHSSLSYTPCGMYLDANGSHKFTLNNDSIVTDSFTINSNISPMELYRRQNGITCSFEISNTTGSFKIYGERINR